MFDRLIEWMDCGLGTVKVREVSGGLEIVECGSGAIDVVIPEEHCGRRIVSVGEGAFREVKNLTSVNIPGSVRTIGNRAFFGCKSLQSVSLSEGLYSIGAQAFQGCSALTELNIPASVGELGDDMVSGCTAIESLAVADGNRGYYSRGNCILRRDGTLIFGCRSSVIPGGTKVIDSGAFMKMPLGEIELPHTVERIGDYAFAWSTLEYIYIPDSVKYIGAGAFLGCDRIEEVTLPRDLEVVRDSCFSDCTSLADIAIPRSVREIENAAFLGCPSIEVVNYEGTRLNWIAVKVAGNNPSLIDKMVFEVSDIYADIEDDESDFESKQAADTGADMLIYEVYDEYVAVVGCDKSVTEIRMPSHYQGKPITRIDTEAFAGCENLRLIVIGTEVGWIRPSAFRSCYALKTVVLPYGIEWIDLDAFSDCTSLSSIEIPDSVSSLGSGAFRRCTSLEDVTLPIGIYALNTETFYGCTSLRSVTIPTNVSTIETRAFMGCTSLTEVVLPACLSKIFPSAFANCTSLTSITLPGRAAEIGEDAFSVCTSLESVKFGYGLERICTRAFYYCTALSEVEIPDGVTFIGESAFSDCKSMRRLTIGKCVKTIRMSAFSGCLSLEQIYYKAIAINQSNMSYSVFPCAGSLTDGITLRIADGVEKLPLCLLTEYMMYTGKNPSLPKISIIEFENEATERMMRDIVASRLCGTLLAAMDLGVGRLESTLEAIK